METDCNEIAEHAFFCIFYGAAGDILYGGCQWQWREGREWRSDREGC